MESRNYFGRSHAQIENELWLERIEQTGVIRVLRNNGVEPLYAVDAENGIIGLILRLGGRFIANGAVLGEPLILLGKEFLEYAEVSQINDVLNHSISHACFGLDDSLNKAITEFSLSGYFNFVPENESDFPN